MSKKTQIGKTLKALRSKKKMTQKDAANTINVNENTYRNWEYGVAEPGIENLIKLSKCFEVLVDDLVSANSWIDVKKQLPKTKLVRVYGKLKHSSFNDVAEYVDGKFWLGIVDATSYVKYWRPIPKDPK